MSGKSDFSDDENFEDDDGDSDFNVDDYPNGNDSNDSFEGEEDDIHRQSENISIDEEANADEYVGPRLVEGHRFDKKFICILYPGNVIDPEKAIETLGGLKEISTAVDTPNRRLELRFRPDDGYCKPACGNRHKTNGFLLRVKIKKKQTESGCSSDTGETASEIMDVLRVGLAQRDELPEDCGSSIGAKIASMEMEVSDLTSRVGCCKVHLEDSCHSSELTSGKTEMAVDDDAGLRSISKEDEQESFDKNKYKDLSQDVDYRLPELKVLGQVDTEFKFRNLCDFQFLPITPSLKNSKVNECIYDLLYPVGVPPYRWLKNKVPYFLPPAAFSRVDSVQLYVPKTETDNLPENIIGKTRKCRVGFSNFIHFYTVDVPTKPPAGIETAMKVKFLQNFHLERVRKVFEQRPIWSKNALMYETKFSSEQLKILLPSVAYYFMTGPWRIMWVKLGYDPRKDASARKYQILDYRLKAMHGLQSTVKCKRSYSNYMLPYKVAPISKSKTTVLSVNMHGQSHKKEKHLHENVYIYRDGTVPPSRQMFYQYCDVLVDEIQEMLAKLPDPAPGTKCQKKMGWLPVGFDDQCREIINKQVRAVLRKQMNIPEDYPTKLPGKRKMGIKNKYYRRKAPESEKIHVVNPNSSSIHMEVVAEESDEEWEEFDDVHKPGTSRQ